MVKVQSPARKYYMAYLTANDDKSYSADFLNFLNMRRYHPGVSKVNIYIAVSAVNERTSADIGIISSLIEMASNSTWLRVGKIIWKGNLGRDFSSAEACLRAISEVASPEDIVMVRNRSGYGPMRPNWYAAYLECLQQDEAVGLVGSTINFLGHPARREFGPRTHVQTYVYMTKWEDIKDFVNEYPGASCKDRLDVIVEGEIGLSSRMMEKGLQLACLAWPGYTFSKDNPVENALPQQDVKSRAWSVPIRYKYRRYFFRLRTLSHLLLWLRRVRKYDNADSDQTSPPITSHAVHQYIDDYE